jgi:hypothetical protein
MPTLPQSSFLPFPGLRNRNSTNPQTTERNFSLTENSYSCIGWESGSEVSEVVVGSRTGRIVAAVARVIGAVRILGLVNASQMSGVPPDVLWFARARVRS